ncbi:MAG: hypothetical protein RBS01_02205 [Candidatus Dojkabacteria bacterium]|jgi:hypothetical protein|nr:hypothetical protein [Candidatus Dojkabacteria bacterium]
MAVIYYANGNQDWFLDNSNHNDKVNFGKPNEQQRQFYTLKAVARMIKAEEEGRVPQGTVNTCLEYNAERLGIEKEELLNMAIPFTIDDEDSETSQIS